MNQFCPQCDVTMDLHDGPDSCDYAQHKADLLSVMDRAFRVGR